MKWEKIGNRSCLSRRPRASFFIEQSGRLFWSRFVSTNGLKAFKMPPKQKLSEAKTMCEDNQHWEDETKC